MENPRVVTYQPNQPEAQIQVTVELHDTYNGYQSSSQGPDQTFTIGTPFTARVVIEERAPITLLLPISL